MPRTMTVDQVIERTAGLVDKLARLHRSGVGFEDLKCYAEEEIGQVIKDLDYIVDDCGPDHSDFTSMIPKADFELEWVEPEAEAAATIAIDEAWRS